MQLSQFKKTPLLLLIPIHNFCFFVCTAIPCQPFYYNFSRSEFSNSIATNRTKQKYFSWDASVPFPYFHFIQFESVFKKGNPRSRIQIYTLQFQFHLIHLLPTATPPPFPVPAVLNPHLFRYPSRALQQGVTARIE